jgi:hypothetical protein
VALANPANYPMTVTSPNALYGFAFHSHTLGTTTALLPSHEPVESETDFTSSPPRSSLSAVPYRRSLLCPQGQRRRGTSPVWMFRRYLQVTARITRIVREDNRIQTPRESQQAEKPASPSGRKLAGIVQAEALPLGATLAGLFDTPHCWNALATLPRSDCPGVLPTFSAQVRTRTGRIRSVRLTQTAPFMLRLSNTSIRLTHPVGVTETAWCPLKPSFISRDSAPHARSHVP